MYFDILSLLFLISIASTMVTKWCLIYYPFFKLNQIYTLSINKYHWLDVVFLEYHNKKTPYKDKKKLTIQQGKILDATLKLLTNFSK